MLTAGWFQRHVQVCGGRRDIALLDVAQEYVLEYLRREGLFDQMLVFKGGTALRKYVFGVSGRFSVDLDFSLRQHDPGDADLVLDLLDGANFAGVRIALERRRGPAAQLRLVTDLGPVEVPSAISIRTDAPWLPVRWQAPQPFAALDRGLAADFPRAPVPIPDVREMAAEKIAAFWRRRVARDLYDLEHLGRALQASFDGPGIAALAALKIYFDVVDEGLGRIPRSLADVFVCPVTDVAGQADLGQLHTKVYTTAELLAQCQRRYSVLAALGGEYARLAMTCNARDHRLAEREREELVGRLSDTWPASARPLSPTESPPPSPSREGAGGSSPDRRNRRRE
ncbi:MAG TPA: nucleotidyl transferase AbiEii/AbiGii toxin family protein [Chloroflexota bacterium]